MIAESSLAPEKPHTENDETGKKLELFSGKGIFADMNDWFNALIKGEWGTALVALVGFVGALAGAVVGFFGLRWQHKASMWQDIRKNVADLLLKGHLIQRAFDSVANPSRGVNDTPVEVTASSAAEMTAIVAYLELVADRRTHGVCSNFLSACDGMARVHAVLVSDSDAVYGPSWNDFTMEWITARNDVLDRVRSTRPFKPALRYRLKNYLARKKFERAP